MKPETVITVCWYSSSIWPARIFSMTPIPKSLVSQTRLFHRRKIEAGAKERYTS
jgi:hypothetical protein